MYNALINAANVPDYVDSAQNVLLKNQSLRESKTLLPLREQALKTQIAGAQSAQAEQAQARNMQFQAMLHEHVQNLSGIPVEQRAAYNAQWEQAAHQSFPEFVNLNDQEDLSDDALRRAFVGTKPFYDKLQSTSGRAGRAVGSPVLVKRDGKTFQRVLVDDGTGNITPQEFEVGAEIADSRGRTTDERIYEAGETAGAKAWATNLADLQMKPEVEAAVKRAVLQAETDATIAEEERSNEKAWNSYRGAIQNVYTALGGTELTGPVAGWIPAFTNEAQVAEGALAVMAPILKSMFRTSGEGTFTDKDQELLMGMLPKRTDGASAIARKVAMIDRVVAAKLGYGDVAIPTITSDAERDALRAGTLYLDGRPSGSGLLVVR